MDTRIEDTYRHKHINAHKHIDTHRHIHPHKHTWTQTHTPIDKSTHIDTLTQIDTHGGSNTLNTSANRMRFKHTQYMQEMM